MSRLIKNVSVKKKRKEPKVHLKALQEVHAAMPLPQEDLLLAEARKETKICKQVQSSLTGNNRLRAFYLDNYFEFAVAPMNAIIPIPISIALSSILNVGVCTPDVMPKSSLAVPNLKKQPGIICE